MKTLRVERNAKDWITDNEKGFWNFSFLEGVVIHKIHMTIFESDSDVPIVRHFLPHIQKLAKANPLNADTNMAKLIKSFRESFDSETTTLFMQDIDKVYEMLSLLDLEELKTKIENGAKLRLGELSRRYPEAKLLYRLINEADKKIPFISQIIFLRSGFHNNAHNIFKALARLYKITKCSGEERANEILSYYAFVSETLYWRFINIVWDLSCILMDKPLETDPEKITPYGSKIKYLIKDQGRLQSLNVVGLIDPKAVKFRNASSHGYFKYLPEKRALLLWDIKSPVEEISYEKLFRKACRLYFISSDVVWGTLSVYTSKNFILGSGICNFIHANGMKIKEKDPETLDALIENYESLHSDVNNYF